MKPTKKRKYPLILLKKALLSKQILLGGLEALAFELNRLEIPIRMATVGPVNKRDIITAQCAEDPLNQIILGFSVKGNTEVQSKLEGKDAEIKFIALISSTNS